MVTARSAPTIQSSFDRTTPGGTTARPGVRQGQKASRYVVTHVVRSLAIGCSPKPQFERARFYAQRGSRPTTLSRRSSPHRRPRRPSGPCRRRFERVPGDPFGAVHEKTALPDTSPTRAANRPPRSRRPRACRRFADESAGRVVHRRVRRPIAVQVVRAIALSRSSSVARRRSCSMRR